MSEQRAVFTIGHSNYSIEKLLGLLQEQRIEAVADIRSYPYSRYAPRFGRVALERSLTAAGIDYRFLGRELGGRPLGDEFHDADGRVDYAVVAASAPFVRGIACLMEWGAPRRGALLCSEEDPRACHRRLLVGRVLAERGWAVEHIRGDGSVEREAELVARETSGSRNNGQLSIFDALGERTWKSARSVSRKGRRPTSSAR
ncbi:MAG: DUF488 domain-containing protein [Chloroflexi bacterium]|nr:DUF488 domain-containing protein [Chloroflexota bacterium]